MNNQKQLVKYAKRFMERLKPSIRKGYDINAVIHPVNNQGAILEFEIAESPKSSISIQPPQSTVNRSLRTIEQQLIQGDIDSVTFKGTNVYLEGNRIVLIKGDDKHESWSNGAVENDIKRILHRKGE